MDRPPISILLVEDNEIDQEAVRRSLNEKYDLRLASTSAEAIAKVRSRRPDAVLLDFRLPGADGFSLLEQFVASKLPVVILTIEERPEVIVEAMQRGAEDFIVKRRLSAAMLSHALDNAIERVNLRRELEQSQKQIAEQARTLADKNRQIEALAAALTLTEQRERHHVAQILHDHLQQVLYALKFRMSGVKSASSNPNSQTFEDFNRLIEDAIHTTRTLTIDLSPPILKGEGLKDALIWLNHQMSDNHDLEVDLQLKSELPVLSQEMRVMIFRLVRELLFNIVKHAGVNRAVVCIDEADANLIVEVQDLGVGFDGEAALGLNSSDESGLGLYSIQRRVQLFGGTVRVYSEPDSGSRIVLELPLERILKVPALGENPDWTGATER